MHVHVSLGESVAVVWPTCLCPCLLVCLLACLLRCMFEFRPLSLGCFGTWSLRLICPRQPWHSTALRRSILSNSGCCGTRLLRWFAADRPLIGRSGFGAWLSRLVPCRSGALLLHIFFKPSRGAWSFIFIFFIILIFRRITHYCSPLLGGMVLVLIVFINTLR